MIDFVNIIYHKDPVNVVELHNNMFAFQTTQSHAQTTSNRIHANA